MKVIIAGSRIIKNYHLVAPHIEAAPFEITEVVCGMAQGIDLIGKEWADRNGIPGKYFPADWKKHGMSAGPIRNMDMAKYADALILIWTGRSRGSRNMKGTMEGLGKPIYEVVL